MQASLPPATWLHLDASHMGVGGDDSWNPTVHPPYLVPPQRYTLALRLVPLPPPAPDGGGGEGWGEAAAARAARAAWRAGREGEAA